MNVRERFNITFHGTGTRPMLFAHGFGCDQTMWRFIAPAFHTEYRVILFDLAGSGGAHPSAYDRKRHATLHGYAQDVLDICDELDLKDVIFVGHSVSAIIGVLAAIEWPERFTRLVLVGPSPRYIDDEDYVGGFSRRDIDGLLETLDSNYLGWVSTMALTIMDNPDRPELAEELKNSFCRTNPDRARAFAKVTFLSDNRLDLPRVRTPSLVLQVSEDVIAPMAVGEYVHRHLAGSELVVLNTRGHCPHLSAPDQTIAAMRAFLGRS
jgi:sigma-B regulation protein RsbQ